MSMGLMANLTQIVNLVSLFIASLRWNHPRNPSDKSLVGGGGDGPASRSVGWLNLARCAPPVRAGSAAAPAKQPCTLQCSERARLLQNKTGLSPLHTLVIQRKNRLREDNNLSPESRNSSSDSFCALKFFSWRRGPCWM